MYTLTISPDRNIIKGWNLSANVRKELMPIMDTDPYGKTNPCPAALLPALSGKHVYAERTDAI